MLHIGDIEEVAVNFSLHITMTMEEYTELQKEAGSIHLENYLSRCLERGRKGLAESGE